MGDEDCNERGEGNSEPCPGPSDSEDDVVSLDAVLRCLLKRRRRQTLYYLQRNQVATVDELAARLLASEREHSSEAVDSDRKEEIAAELVHVHLPHLAEAKAIEFDQRSRTVRYSEPPALVAELLDVLARIEGDRE